MVRHFATNVHPKLELVLETNGLMISAAIVLRSILIYVPVRCLRK